MIWADALHHRRKRFPSKKYADIAKDELSFLSIITSFNIATLLPWISYYFNGSIPKFELGIFIPGSLIDRIVSFSILVYIPSLILNYFVIIFRGEYQKIVVKYPYRNGKLALYYSLGSIAVFVLFSIVLGICIRMGITF